MFESGPVTVKREVYNGTLPSLVSTTYSWTKVSSIIYLDQPVGTGFSYSRTQLVNKPSDSGEAKRIHEFLYKWLGKHQEFLSNPFYVGGDSYSGMVIPAIVQEVSKVYALLTTYWANDENVRSALHVNKGSIGEWVRCNWEIPYTHDIKSSVPYHMNNSIDGYPSLIFSGDHDMMVPFLGTQAWIRSLNYSIIDDWRPWMIGDQIAGYTRTYANKMTFATIKGGGHTPEYKPEESYIMFQRWISGQPL